MSVLDNTLPSVVQGILTTYGKDAVFVVPGAYVYDVATGEGRTLSKKTYTHKVTPPAPYETKYVDGETILRTDLVVYVEATGLAFVPDVNTRIRLDAKEFEIIAASPIYSGDNVLLFELQLRG